MKISIVCFTGHSGLTDYSISLSKALSRLNHTVTLYTGKTCSTVFDSLGFDIIRVFNRTRNYPFDILQYVFKTLINKPECIIFQNCIRFPLIDTLLVIIFKRLSIKTIIEVHDVLPHYPKPYDKLIFSTLYRAFDSVITHSKAAKDSLIKMGVKCDILIVPHGIHDIFNLTDLTKEQARKHFQVADDEFVALFFGFLEPRKGFIHAMNAAKLSFEEGRAIKYIFAGDCDISRFGLKYGEAILLGRKLPNVILKEGRVAYEDVEKYFRAADVVIIPYLEGTTSGVLKLAISFSTPVLATDIGDIVEQLPINGGVILKNVPPSSREMVDGLLLLSKNIDSYSIGIRNYDESIEWTNIASRICYFLSK